MYNKATSILNILSDNGYLAYIVGGYPRDSILGIDTLDIDICTNAKPKEIISIFDASKVSDVSYGSVKVRYKGYTFDVTTFRRDIKYEDNRKPVKIKYINDLKRDLLRRDFTINTICIDRYGNYIDLLDANKDIENKIIRTVGNPRYKIKEDSLRILRAIRFASTLGFSIDDKTKYYIKKYAYLLKKLSASRKKEELNKIFSSKNRDVGIKLLVEYGIDKYLGIMNMNNIVIVPDIIGIWSQLDFPLEYPFSKIEMNNIRLIRELMDKEITSYSVYKYGLYISSVVGSIKGISYKKINSIYKSLPIYSRKDICVNGMDIAKILNKEPGKYVSEILSRIEVLIVDGNLVNSYDEIVNYVSDNYGRYNGII